MPKMYGKHFGSYPRVGWGGVSAKGYTHHCMQDIRVKCVCLKTVTIGAFLC